VQRAQHGGDVEQVRVEQGERVERDARVEGVVLGGRGAQEEGGEGGGGEGRAQGEERGEAREGGGGEAAREAVREEGGPFVHGWRRGGALSMWEVQLMGMEMEEWGLFCWSCGDEAGGFIHGVWVSPGLGWPVLAAESVVGVDVIKRPVNGLEDFLMRDIKTLRH